MGFCLLLAAVPGATSAADQKFDTPSGMQVPRWAMLNKSEVNARNGPSMDNRVVWTYTKNRLPVQIISETADWRLICDPDGKTAWVKKTMIASQKTVLSLPAGKLALRSGPRPDADIRAMLRPRSMAALDKCKDGWCKISADSQNGWVPQSSLWGTQSAAVCHRPDPFASN